MPWHHHHHSRDYELINIHNHDGGHPKAWVADHAPCTVHPDLDAAAEEATQNPPT